MWGWAKNNWLRTHTYLFYIPAVRIDPGQRARVPDKHVIDDIRRIRHPHVVPITIRYFLRFIQDVRPGLGFGIISVTKDVDIIFMRARARANYYHKRTCARDTTASEMCVSHCVALRDSAACMDIYIHITLFVMASRACASAVLIYVLFNQR